MMNKEQKNNLKRILADLVSIPSAYPSEEKIGNYIAKWLDKYGFSVHKQKISKNRWNILAESQGISKKKLLLMGHLDTVLVQDHWKTNPYQLTEENGKLYGLGAWDMKAGIAAILSLVQENVNRSPLKIAFVVDEENVSIGAHKLVQSGWLRGVESAIVCEPGFLHGEKGIALGRVGRSVYKITVTTDGGHVYLSGSRVNAIETAYKVIETIKQIPTSSHKLLGTSLLFPRSIVSKGSGMAIPSYVEIEIEGQLVPPQTTESILNLIKQKIGRAFESYTNVDVMVTTVSRETPFCQPFIVAKDRPFVKLCFDTLKSVLGQKPVFYYRRSVGDENRLAQLGISVLTIGPGGGNAHQANEWVSLNSLIQVREFLVAILKRYR